MVGAAIVVSQKEVISALTILLETGFQGFFRLFVLSSAHCTLRIL
jgi:hypothetical protein